MNNIEAAKVYLAPDKNTFVGVNPTDKGECVGLFNQVNLDVMGIKYPIKGASTAIKLLSATNTRPDLIEQVLMSSGRKPSIGDWVIWNKTWGGGAGHISCVESLTDNGFVGIEQNFVPNKVTRQKHDWTNVAGYIHYKQGENMKKAIPPEIVAQHYANFTGRQDIKPNDPVCQNRFEDTVDDEFWYGLNFQMLDIRKANEQTIKAQEAEIAKLKKQIADMGSEYVETKVYIKKG